MNMPNLASRCQRMRSAASSGMQQSGLAATIAAPAASDCNNSLLVDSMLVLPPRAKPFRSCPFSGRAIPALIIAVRGGSFANKVNLLRH